MKFREWRLKHGVRVSWREPGKPERWDNQDGAEAVAAVFDKDIPEGAKWELWHLSDYRVSAILSGPCVQLVRIK